MIILYVLLGLIALLLLVGLVSKRSYTIVRETTVSAPSQTVFDYIRHLKNQDHYSKWNMTDPAKRTTFTGEDGTVGFIYAWDGNKQAGAGEQEIMGIKPGESIETEVRFIRPFAGLAQFNMTAAPTPGQSTKVRWSMSSGMKYPMNLLLLFMNMEKMLGKDMEISLQNLKGILEK